MSPKNSQRVVTEEELAKHASQSDVWTVVDGVVYDLTEFAPNHPGGIQIILKYAGKDATATYSQVHGPSTIIEGLPPSKRMGKCTVTKTTDTTTKSLVEQEKPDLGSILSSYDFEQVAATTFSKKAWAFYSTAATDLVTRDNNKAFFDRIIFRPRALRDVSKVNLSCTMLGCPSNIPVFMAPVGMARLAHPDGEKAFAVAAAATNIPQCISTVASYSASEIISAAPNAQFFFQLYVDKDRSKTKALLQRVQNLGVRAIFVTVDATVPGKRESDERVRADESLVSPMASSTMKNDAKGSSIARVMGAFIDTKLRWSDIPWLRECTNLPIVIKGIMGAADARLALEHKVEGIVVSNHGGRNLDGCPPAILVLLELQRRCPDVSDHMEVYLDGGIRRGTDIVKALALGATGVAVGRPFLFSLGYGPEGVEKMVEIFKDEMQTTMQLLGVGSVEELHPGLINTADIDHLVPTSDDHPYATWSRAGRRNISTRSNL
ncbi:related to glycolate oxidase [Rhynchosporium graminicola]|uniref:L-lactate dehydrogenase (cytochrome) n=1 Tax=Rhynchosporium graminicola TaxID=2792576 RepID=A0A1E1L2M1_9HELO|nr:related to glycolate oxidase [Rhynchosporium commune]